MGKRLCLRIGRARRVVVPQHALQIAEASLYVGLPEPVSHLMEKRLCLRIGRARCIVVPKLVLQLAEASLHVGLPEPVSHLMGKRQRLRIGHARCIVVSKLALQISEAKLYVGLPEPVSLFMVKRLCLSIGRARCVVLAFKARFLCLRQPVVCLAVRCIRFLHPRNQLLYPRELLNVGPLPPCKYRKQPKHHQPCKKPPISFAKTCEKNGTTCLAQKLFGGLACILFGQMSAGEIQACLTASYRQPGTKAAKHAATIGRVGLSRQLMNSEMQRRRWQIASVDMLSFYAVMGL